MGDLHMAFRRGATRLGLSRACRGAQGWQASLDVGSPFSEAANMIRTRPHVAKAEPTRPALGEVNLPRPFLHVCPECSRSPTGE